MFSAVHTVRPVIYILKTISKKKYTQMFNGLFINYVIGFPSISIVKANFSFIFIIFVIFVVLDIVIISIPVSSLLASTPIRFQIYLKLRRLFRTRIPTVFVRGKFIPMFTTTPCEYIAPFSLPVVEPHIRYVTTTSSMRLLLTVIGHFTIDFATHFFFL